MEPLKTKLGSKWRREVNRVWVAFNHKRNGEIIAQQFSDTEELPNSWSRNWVVVEKAADKIEAFKSYPHVANLVVLGEASDAYEALRMAREKFGMKPIEKEKI